MFDLYTKPQTEFCTGHHTQQIGDLPLFYWADTGKIAPNFEKDTFDRHCFDCHAMHKPVPAMQYSIIRGDINALSKPEFVNYFQNWKPKLNPDSKDFDLTYACCGPDLLTPLMTTNFTEMKGIDLKQVDATKLRTFLEHPSFIGYDVSPRDFKTVLERRKDKAFWDTNLMTNVISIEGAIVHELNSLGVDLDKVSVKEVEGSVELVFDWAYPGEQVKPRKVTYIKDDIFSYLARGGPKAGDALLVKSGKSYDDPESGHMELEHTKNVSDISYQILDSDIEHEFASVLMGYDTQGECADFNDFRKAGWREVFVGDDEVRDLQQADRYLNEYCYKLVAFRRPEEQVDG